MKWIAGGAVLLLALLFVAAAVLSGNEKAKLRSEGERATAVVVDKYVESQKTSKRTTQTSRCLKVKFQAGERQVDGITCDYVSEALYEATPVGSEVSVVYLARTLEKTGEQSWHAYDLALEAALAD